MMCAHTKAAYLSLLKIVNQSIEKGLYFYHLHDAKAHYNKAIILADCKEYYNATMHLRAISFGLQVCDLNASEHNLYETR